MDVPKTPTPPATDATKPAQEQATLVLPDMSSLLFSWYVILPMVFLVLFHLGAGYLSFQKYANPLWAIVDFLFPYFYYPYYAFFLAKDPGPSAVTGMIGGKRGMMSVLKKLMK